MKKIVLVVLCVFLCCMPVYANDSMNGFHFQEEIDSLKSLLEDRDSEEIQKIVEFIKDKWEAGALSTDQDIQDAIREGEEEFDASLSEEDKETIQKVINKVQELGIDPEILMNHVLDKFEDTTEDLTEQAKEVVTESVKKSVAQYFSELKVRVRDFVVNLIS